MTLSFHFRASLFYDRTPRKGNPMQHNPYPPRARIPIGAIVALPIGAIIRDMFAHFFHKAQDESLLIDGTPVEEVALA